MYGGGVGWVELHSLCSHHLHSHSITQTPGRCDKLHPFLLLSVPLQRSGLNLQVHIVPVPTQKPQQVTSRAKLMGLSFTMHG